MTVSTAVAMAAAPAGLPPGPRPGTPMLDIRLHSPDPAVVVVRIDGCLDAPSIPLFVARVGQQLGRAPHVVLDLQEVPFLSVRGLQALLELQHRAELLGTQLHIAAEHHTVRRPLRVSGLDRLIPVSATSEWVIARHRRAPLRARTPAAVGR